MDWIQLLMLVAIAVFYFAYFAKALLLKRRGISTQRMGRGSKPRRTCIIEALLSIATFGMAAVQLVSLFWLTPFMFPSFVRIGGAALSFLGTLVFITAMVQMRDSWRAGVDETQKTRLVTSGIYRISRNPAFVGFDLFYLGTLFALPNPLSIGFALFAILMMHLQILEEEKYLPGVFGKDYEDYRRKTRRYL
ncbi:methyltransferase family protein [Candidatus Soleaferrea massiliensis]|uniref:methyltransferase family protein n=1 Tax=Candidatus Soleaferrea massiliensis TaxID=1470354 RepID=UPI00058C23BD|nr:isoprenylcysteine carboxylmethyltransferase family protein [Candidatus Soleaferrea massiliensis]